MAQMLTREAALADYGMAVLSLATTSRLPPSGADLQPGEGGPALSGLELTQRRQARGRRLAGLPHEETGERGQDGGDSLGVCGLSDRVVVEDRFRRRTTLHMDAWQHRG